MTEGAVALFRFPAPNVVIGTRIRASQTPLSNLRFIYLNLGSVKEYVN